MPLHNFAIPCQLWLNSVKSLILVKSFLIGVISAVTVLRYSPPVHGEQLQRLSNIRLETDLTGPPLALFAIVSLNPSYVVGVAGQFGRHAV